MKILETPGKTGRVGSCASVERDPQIYKYYLAIRPAAPKGYWSIAHEARPNGLLTHGP